MAHLEKYRRSDIAKVAREAYREHRNRKAYRNNVDLKKSHLNYSIEGFTRQQCLDKLDARCFEVMEGRKIQSQTAVVGSWVHTVPQEILGDAEKEREFFRHCYEFNKERYGAENVLDGIVHYDETTPHMTVYVVPATISRKTGKFTISSASLFNRKELLTYHDDLESYLFERMKIHGLGKNGRTKGGFTIEELKERTKQEEKTRKLEEEQRRIINNIKLLQEENNELEKRITKLKKEIRTMETKETISKEGFLTNYNRYIKKGDSYSEVNGKQYYDSQCKKHKKQIDIKEFMKKFDCFKRIRRTLDTPTRYIHVNCYEEYLEECERANNDTARGDKELNLERRLPDISNINFENPNDRQPEF